MSEKYLTLREALRHIESEIGVRISTSTAHKDACIGRGMKPAAKFGPKLLYTPEQALEYARNRIVRLSSANG
jgi:hypothetical protein